MKSKRLSLEKPRPVSYKRLDPKHKSGRVFQQSLLKSVTGPQESRTSNSHSEAVTRSDSGSVTGSASKSDCGSAMELVGVSVTGSATVSATVSVTVSVTESVTESVTGPVKISKLNLHQN